MLTPIDYLIVTLIFIVGGLVVSTVGFGLGITASPFLLLFVDPQTTVVAVNTVILIPFAYAIFQNRDVLPVRQIAPIAIAAMLGAPIGVYFLSTVNASILRISIIGLILVLTTSIAFGVSLPPTTLRRFGLILGFVVGIMISALGIGGPLIVLYLLARSWSSRVIRGSLALCFLAINSISVIVYMATGLYTAERLGLIAVVTAPTLIAFLLGAKVVRLFDESVFRKAVLTVVVISSLMVLFLEILDIQDIV